MKIALLGYGKMGQLIEKVALANGHEVLSILKRDLQDWDQIAKADTWIDFSDPSLVLGHFQKAQEMKKNLVIGTTGWEEHLPLIKEQSLNQDYGVLYAPNCSLGMLLFLKILKKSAQIMKPFKDYEVAGFEAHHSQKKDSPSGTACKISAGLKEQLGFDVPFTSLRLGSIPGKHEVYFDSPIDSITLTHEAKSREGFARGALIAASWLEGKKGFYTLDDYIEGLMQNA